MGTWRTCAGNDTRAGAARAVPIVSRRRPCRVKPMDASPPKGGERDGGGRREGGTQTSHAARRGARPPADQRVRRPVMCRRAEKPRRGSIVRRAGLRIRGTVWGCGDGPLKGCESARGAPVRRKPAREARPREDPVGVETPSGCDGTNARRSGSGAVSPERRGTPGEGRADAARRRRGSPYASKPLEGRDGLDRFLRQSF
jgi:hypothetical protein